MGTITVSVEDKVEAKFRKAVKAAIGTKKGSLGKALTQAMNGWAEEARQKKIAKEMLEILDKGFEMGRFSGVSRDELHGRGN